MRIKLVIWIASSLAVSILAFGDLWAKLPEWLSTEGLQRQGVFHWGVLGLCGLWLWLKRKNILSRMTEAKINIALVIIGAVLVGLSLLLPKHDSFLVFLMLLGWLGFYTIIFDGAFITPAILLTIYLFSLAFPLLVGEWIGESAASVVANTVVFISKILGIEIASQGAVLQFNSLAGGSIRTIVSPGCAGFATIGAFVALFSLMMLDVRLPFKRASYEPVP